MKKVLAIAVVGVFGLASCKKDYTCDCKGDNMSISVPLNGYKKKAAEDACSSAETTYKNADATTKCTLK